MNGFVYRSIFASMLASLAVGCVDEPMQPRPADGPADGEEMTTGITTFSTMTDPTNGDVTASAGDEDSGTDGGTDEGDDESTTSGSDESGDEGDDETGTDTAEVEDDTIYEIQDGTIPSGTEVDVRGVIVTGVANSGFFVQEPFGGEYGGVYVYTETPPTVLVGDEVDLRGIAAEFGELTEIDISRGMVSPTGVQDVILSPAPIALSEISGGAGEPWEGVLVRIEGMPLSVVALPGSSEFDVGGAGPETVRIDNFLYNVFDVPETYVDFGVDAGFMAINGPLNFNGGEFKVAPRSAEDLEGYVPGPGLAGTSVEDLVPGDLVITELMYDPGCSSDTCEWIEIYNASGLEVNLFGLRIQDSALSEATQGVIMDDLLLADGEYAVLARGDAAGWPYAVAPTAYYGSNPGLNNTGDFAVLANSTEVLDQTATYPNLGAADDGISWKLDPTMIDGVANDMAANWCLSTVVFDSPGGNDELGSPGAANEAGC
ncbi:MAG: lamin tail domain-containing protein [Myxococcota bacterium]